MSSMSSTQHLHCPECGAKISGRDRPSPPSPVAPPRELRFFKIMFGDFKESLFIPPNLRRALGGLVNQHASLKDTDGHSWRVEVCLVDGILAFQKGWRDFVLDHSIEYGDFLVFEQMDTSRFFVRIFGKSACEILQFNEQCKTNRNEKKAKNISDDLEPKAPKQSLHSGTNPRDLEHPVAPMERRFLLSMEGICYILDGTETTPSGTKIDKGKTKSRRRAIKKNLRAKGTSGNAPQIMADMNSNQKDPDLTRNKAQPAVVAPEDKENASSSLKLRAPKKAKTKIRNSNALKSPVKFTISSSVIARSWLRIHKRLPAYSKNPRHVVLLRDPSMRLWPVLYHQGPKFTGFTEGWEDMSARNHFQLGDRVVFEATDEAKTFQVRASNA